MSDSPPRPRRAASLVVGSLVFLLLGGLASCALLFGPSAEELERIRVVVAEDEPLVIDVRSPGEFAEEHLEGALNIPVGELEGRLDELGPKDRALVVY